MKESNGCLGKAASCATIIGLPFAIIGVLVTVLTYIGYNPFISDGTLITKKNNSGYGSSTQGTTSEISPRLENKEITENSLTMHWKNASFKMILVEGGTFMMGTHNDDNDAPKLEKPAHQVTLSNYYIGETEVTQLLWKEVMDNDTLFQFKGSNRPVENVSWYDCQDFISKLSANLRKSFRLPTEAEWEFAARGGNESRGFIYSGSMNIDEVAWYKHDTIDYDTNISLGTHDVKTKQPNELGIYDMSGNVFEWCSDWIEYYDSVPKLNPQGAAIGTYRVARGGCWGFSASFCRSSRRGAFPPNEKASVIGLRLVLSEL